MPSKKIGNHVHALGLHYFHYNFIRKYQTLKKTPAVAAGLANVPLTVLDLAGMIEAEVSKLKGRLTDYLPAASKNPNIKVNHHPLVAVLAFLSRAGL